MNDSFLIGVLLGYAIPKVLAWPLWGILVTRAFELFDDYILGERG